MGIITDMNAAASIKGMYTGGNTIIRRSTVARGFLRVWATSAVVTIAAQKTALMPKSILIEQPIHIPQKITGKKCPPFNPESMQMFVRSSFATAIRRRVRAPMVFIPEKTSSI